MWAQWVNVFLFLELFTYASVVAAHHAIVHYRMYRERQDAAVRLELTQERLRTEAARAKLQSLQMELQPHFLFNTFNAIAALVRRNENTAAVEMLVRLGELLRQTLERGETLRIPLDEELDLARCYLGIQQVRFPGLRVTSEVEPEAGRALVPTLFLQPLLENAVRYGLSPSGAAHVRVLAKVAEGRLRVEVEDPGSGGGRAGDRSGHGIGLANTRARLEQLWGAGAHVVLDRLASGGMRVVLDVPFVPADVGDDEPRRFHAARAGRPRAVVRSLGINTAPGAV
jgi:LytS/YehU family sensor histidine kinase